MYAAERDLQFWDEWHRYATAISDIPSGATRVLFYREGKSHRGLASLTDMSMLKARQVNQDFLCEIGELTNLTYLELDSLSAEDLSPLLQLTRLKTIKLNGARRIRDFSALVRLPSLEKLFLTNMPNLTDLSFLADANQLASLGVEGSMWTMQRIDSLKPLTSLKALIALFMTSVTLIDKRLDYLAAIPNLRILECARFSSKTQFDVLRQLMPNLKCRWCDEYEPIAG
jgi:hypothetical protein